jgi:hypothetical protein
MGTFAHRKEFDMEYKYKGALALVELHEIHLRQFVETWKKGKEAGIKLPETDDPYYKSMDTLVFHVLRSARNYMVWICGKLNLPDPGIELPPENVADNTEEYINYLSEKWKTPLAGVEENFFHEKTYTSNWGVDYCIDAMLEHAVMHPVRHGHQLVKLMRK